MALIQNLTDFRNSYASNSRESIWKVINDNCCPCCIEEEKVLLDSALSTGIHIDEVDRIIKKLRLSDLVSPSVIKKFRTICFLNSQNISNTTLSDLQNEIDRLLQLYGSRVVINSDDIVFTTEPITLSFEEMSINFGRFAIYFNCTVLQNALNGCNPRVRAIALDPHPMSRHNYFHPHIGSYGEICLGEAMEATMIAAIELNLTAFFEIVETILNTYNPSSPFVPLENWIGVPCIECGAYYPDSELHTCPFCSTQNICDECASSCDNCGNPRCSDCSRNVEHSIRECVACKNEFCTFCADDNDWSTCNKCSNWVCGDCLHVCDDCGKGAFCPDCSATELVDGLCKSCLEKKQAEEETEEESEEEKSDE